LLVCKQCKKECQQGNKFCMYCGSPIEVSTESGPLGTDKDSGIGKEKKTGAAAVVGMFIVNCIPILGFPFAFIWAQSKYKGMKLKLSAFTVLFIVLNITATIFGYTAMISFMKNSLAKAAEEKIGTLTVLSEQGRIPGSGNVSPLQINLTDIPQLDSSMLQNIPGLDSETMGQLMPDISGIMGGSGSYDSEDHNIPEDINMPTTDEEGNMYIDYDGDGKYDMVIDKDGNVISQNSGTPSVDSEGNVYMDTDEDGVIDTTIDSSGNITSDGNMPEVDEDGNIYFDSNGDGKNDSFLDKHGNIIPMDSKVDEKGNRYVDYDGDGKCEVLIDIDGIKHYDMDGDGTYETTYEEEYGEG
jgi:hypothetical protein